VGSGERRFIGEIWIRAQIAGHFGQQSSEPPVRHPVRGKNSSDSRRPEPERIALLVSMINQAGRSSCDGAGILSIGAGREPIAGCPVPPYAASLS
jgi:hypothetical protein